jgi:hypothetical protein
MTKFLNIFKILIGVLAAVLFVRIMIEDDELIKDSAELQNSLISPDLWLSYIILGIAVVATLIFTVIGVAKGNIKKTLISVGLFVLVIAVSYLGFAGDYGTGFDISDTETLSESGAKWIGTGLYTFYFLALAAVVSMFVSTIKKATTN